MSLVRLMSAIIEAKGRFVQLELCLDWDDDVEVIGSVSQGPIPEAFDDNTSKSRL